MVDKSTHEKDQIMRCTSEIVSSFLGNNSVPLEQVEGVIDVVHRKMTDLYWTSSRRIGNKTPAVPIEDSVTPDHIVCLEDGKKFKMLKKHLKAQYDMSPEDYRAKWELPTDYPMVAPNYAIRRQELARASGLGKSRK